MQAEPSGDSGGWRALFGGQRGLPLRIAAELDWYSMSPRLRRAVVLARENGMWR